MAVGAALPNEMPSFAGEAVPVGGIVEDARSNFAPTVIATRKLADVETLWRTLEAPGIDSPGQSFAFIKLWIAALGIAEADQLYLVGEVDGAPVALLPLLRRRARGIRLLSWFPGSHVGCNAPLVDTTRLRAMSPTERSTLWHKMRASAVGADLLYLKSVPEHIVEGVDLFAELGRSLTAETLYRARFASWDEANATQRTKSRRKHDRQQGDRLEAMGEVAFEEIESGDKARVVLEIMFRQRAARFRDMGVPDPFTAADIRRFYDWTVQRDSGVAVKLHVLWLNGDVAAVRYNIAASDRLFCLISSMSDDPAIQAGSPGKQCLLRVMQTVFDAGYRVFDMGAGLTDEKRHWCNEQIPVRHHYLPLTRRGALAASAHHSWQTLRGRIKSDEKLSRAARSARGFMLRITGKAVPVETPGE